MYEINKELLHNCGVIPVLDVYSQDFAEVARENGLEVVAVNEELYYGGTLLGNLPGDPDILTGIFDDASLNAAMKNPNICAAVDKSFSKLDIVEFSKRCHHVRKIALGYHFAHLGINHKDGAAAAMTAKFLENAFAFPSFDIGSSIISEGSFELVKTSFRGKNGHVGIETASVARAIADLRAKGFAIDENSIQRSEDGKILSAYLEDETAGFGWHLLQKR